MQLSLEAFIQPITVPQVTSHKCVAVLKFEPRAHPLPNPQSIGVLRGRRRGPTTGPAFSGVQAQLPTLVQRPSKCGAPPSLQPHSSTPLPQDSCSWNGTCLPWTLACEHPSGPLPPPRPGGHARFPEFSSCRSGWSKDRGQPAPDCRAQGPQRMCKWTVEGKGPRSPPPAAHLVEEPFPAPMRGGGGNKQPQLKQPAS